MKSKINMIINILGLVIGILYIMSGFSEYYENISDGKYIIGFGILVVIIFSLFIYKDIKNKNN